jgi:hypothetical protein
MRGEKYSRDSYSNSNSNIRKKKSEYNKKR